MKYLSVNKLGTILMMMKHCADDENFHWTKSDSKLYIDVMDEIRYLRHKDYLKRKEL